MNSISYKIFFNQETWNYEVRKVFERDNYVVEFTTPYYSEIKKYITTLLEDELSRLVIDPQHYINIAVPA